MTSTPSVQQEQLQDKSNTCSEQLWNELPPGHYSDGEALPLPKQVHYMDVKSGKRTSDICDRQIFIPFNIDRGNGGKLIALLDTGADVNLITEEYLRRQAPSWRNYKDCQEQVKIKSVTGDSVKPLAHKLLPIRFEKCSVVHMPFVIMKEDLPVKCIIGRPSLAQLQASLLFFNADRSSAAVGCDRHYYVLKITHPKVKYLPLTHIKLPGLFQVFASNVKLKPKQTTVVNFELKINPFLTSDSQCLISAHDMTLPDGVTFFETKCMPYFRKDGIIQVTGVIVNDTSETYSFKKFTGVLEELHGHYDIVSIAQKQPMDQDMEPDDNNNHLYYTNQDDYEEKTYMVANINLGPDKKYKKLLRSAKHTASVTNLEGLSFPSYQCRSTAEETVYQCCHIRVSDSLEPDSEPFETAEELLEEEIMPSIRVPTKLPTTKDVVMSSINRETEEVQPYLKKIFIEQFPSVVGTHNLDTGPVRYLGRIVLRTKPGMKLPKSTKVYAIHPSDQQHLDDILSFMQKYGFISEVFQDDPTRPSAPHGAAAYLIKRKLIKGENVPNQGAPSFGRLIIDYRSGGLNSILEDTPALVKGIETCLEQLRGSFMYSLIDLKQSYYGLCLHSKSFALTQFLVFPGRSFVWHRVPMGVCTAPASLLEKCNLMLNYVPERDENGKVLFESGEGPTDEASRAKLLPDKIENCINFYDDLLIFSPKSKKMESGKFEHSRDEHFAYVERLIGRMALYGFKITYPKCSWGKRFVDFLGWRVQDDKLYADEARIEKVKRFEYPKSRKGLQSFVGLVNTLKRVSPLCVGEYLAVLSSAISSKTKFEFKLQHQEAFDKLKQALTSQPLYCHLIDPSADKIIFTDSSSLAFGSVLLSRVDNQSAPTFQSHIDQTDPDELNQVIRKWSIKAYIGEKYSRSEDSFFKAVLFLIRYHKLHLELQDTLELRQAVIKHVKSTTVGKQVKEQFCNGNHQSFHKFLHDRIGNLSAPVSKKDAVIYMVASYLKRGINIISADLTQTSVPLHEVIPDLKNTATPFTIGVYPTGNDTTAGYFVPLLEYKDWEFNPELLNSKYVINYYDSRIIPTSQRSKSILELESTALLHALKKYRSFITNCKVHVITDSRSLFYLFSQAVVQSHTKVSRFNLKLQADFPQVQVLWCSTFLNLADIFTRFGLTDEFESKIKFTAAKVEHLPEIPNGMTFSWETWDNIVKSHPKALEILMDYAKTYNTKDKKKLEKIREAYHPTNELPASCSMQACSRQSEMTHTDTLYVNTVQKVRQAIPESAGGRQEEQTCVKAVNFTKIAIPQLLYLIKPIRVMRERVSRENIRIQQKEELKDLYSELFQSDKLYIKKGKLYYTLLHDTIYCTDSDNTDAEMRIVIPKTFEILILAFLHLSFGHSSIESTIRTLQYTYHFYNGQVRPKVAAFIRSCTTCAINARETGKIALQHLSLDPSKPPFYYLCIDLAENVTPFGNMALKLAYKHLLVCKCMLTSYTLVYPLKDKTTKDVLYGLVYGLFQSFGLPGQLYSDNASIFGSKQFVTLMETLNVEVKETVPYDSKSRGFVERAVRSTKQTVRKLLHAWPDRESNMVEYLPFLGSLNINANVNMRTRTAPSKTVFGHLLNTNGLFAPDDFTTFMDAHILRGDPNVSSLPGVIYRENENVYQNAKKAEARSDKSVRRPVTKSLPPGTLIYVLQQGPGTAGVSPTWNPYYLPSIFCVTRELKTAVVATRLSDQTTIFRSKNDVKRARFWHRLEELPENVKTTLFLEYNQLSQEQLDLLARLDNFGDIPEARQTRDSAKLLEDIFKQDNQDLDELLEQDAVYDSEEDEDPEQEQEMVPQMMEDSDDEDENKRGSRRITFNIPNA